MEFITSENVELLWEIIMEEDIVKVIPINRINEFRQFYIGQVKQYYELVGASNLPLVRMNQDFISGFMKKLQPIPPQQTQQTQQTPPKKKEFYTSEEIQTDKRSQFDSELTRKQNEFKNAMTVQVPEIPKFGDQLDKPLGSAMDILIAKTLAERNYDVQMIQNQNASSVGNVEKFLKSQETSVKVDKTGYSPTVNASGQSQSQNKIKYIKIGDEIDDNTLKSKNVIDLSSQKMERLDKKNVSWGNNEYQEFGQQNSTEIQNTLFSKLKYVAPNNEVDGLKSEINDLKIQIGILNDKFDQLMSKTA
jgi:hypothetical protein